MKEHTGTLYFSDDGTPIEAEPAAPDRAMGELDFIEDALIDLHADVTPQTVAILETLLEQAATARAALMVGELLHRLDGTAGAVALQRAICGDAGETQREAAQRAGVRSKTTLIKQERRIRLRLGCPTSTPMG